MGSDRGTRFSLEHSTCSLRLLALFGALGLSACTVGPAANTPDAARFTGGTLRVALTVSPGDYLGNPAFLDPQQELGQAFVHELERCCLERTLLSFNGKPAEEGGADLRPDLAAAMPEISDDGLTWTFRLKQGIHYAPPLHDVEVTAGDIVRALERLATPSISRGGWGEIYSMIEGFDDYGKRRATSIGGLETPDPYTLRVHVTEPWADGGYAFSDHATAPIPPNPADPSAAFGVAEGHDDGYGRFLVASGPYMIEGSERLDFSKPPKAQTPASGLVPGESLTLVRNPSWDPATDALRHAYADRIELRGFTLEEAARAIDRGTVDLILDTSNPPDQISRYRSDPELSHRVFTQPTNMIAYAAMRLTAPPFDDIHVRRAVNYAFDAAKANRLSSAFPYGDYGYVLSVPIGHIAPDSTEDNLLRDWDPYPFDLAKAREEMALSRYDRDHDGSCDAAVCKHIRTLDTDLGPEPRTERVWRQGLREIGITLDFERLGFSRFQRESGDPSDLVAFNVGPWWIGTNPTALELFPPLFRAQSIPHPCFRGCFPFVNISLVGESRHRLAAWGYPVTSVPNVDSEIGDCLARSGFTQQLCWAELDQLLMIKVVPWVPWFNAYQARVVSSRVVRFSFDQSIFLVPPALDQIAVGTD